MKRFKRPISEVAKGLFHQGSGDSKPIIPNLGVNSKKAESSSPYKLLGGSIAPKEKTQSQKNAETRKSGKAVSYEDAYADADMKKYGGEGGKEKFIADAKAYNEKKYNTENPTADSKKAGKTKAQLAKDVAAKKADVAKTADSTPKAEVKKTDVAPKAEVKKTKAEKIAAKGDAKVEKIKARKAKRAERKAGRVEKRAARKQARVDNRAARKEARAKVKAAKKGDSSPAKKHSKMKYKK